MCEPFVTALTGLTVREHQRRTTEGFLELRDRVGAAYIMPVIQGFTPNEYSEHVAELSRYLDVGAWVGVGSVCKRQGNPAAISAVLTAILNVRPDLRLHGFGVKSTALKRSDVWSRFYSVDSMAWSFIGRRRGRGPNSLDECLEWTAAVKAIEPQPSQVALGL